jgi:hypothetical protein
MTTLTTDEIVRRARRLIRAATGEDYGDGYTVTDMGIGYAEPGYHDDTTVWVTGNWNDKSFDSPTLAERVPSRLFDALERLGVECEWLDEWVQCENCYRLFRTQGDSYSWKMSGAYFGDGYSCTDCMLSYGDDALEDYVNDASRAVTWCGAAHLESLGWARYNGDFENGWHPGQDDDPERITRAIQGSQDDVDIIFLIDHTEQFSIGFSAYTRAA